MTHRLPHRSIIFFNNDFVNNNTVDLWNQCISRATSLKRKGSAQMRDPRASRSPGDAKAPRDKHDCQTGRNGVRGHGNRPTKQPAQRKRSRSVHAPQARRRYAQACGARRRLKDAFLLPATSAGHCRPAGYESRNLSSFRNHRAQKPWPATPLSYAIGTTSPQDQHRRF